MSPELNSRQRRNLAALAKPEDGLPVFPEDIGEQLEVWLTEQLEPILAAWTGEPLFVGKRDLSLAGSSECEQRRAYDADAGFSWSVPTAVGSLTHKCAQLRLNAGTIGIEPDAADVYDWAWDATIADEWGLGGWLKALPDGQRAELTGLVQEGYVSFLECFPVPRVSRRWQPIAEAKTTWELGPLKAAGKVDIRFGKLWGDDNGGSGSALLDLKGGRVWPGHQAEQRHYALLQALKTGVPPRLLGILSLETGALTVEHVTEDTLWGAAALLVAATAAVARLADVDAVRAVRPGGLCRFCDASQDGRCEPGALFLKKRR